MGAPEPRAFQHTALPAVPWRREARLRRRRRRRTRRLGSAAALAAVLAALIPLAQGASAQVTPGLPASYVAQAQVELQRLGLPVGGVDGVDGPMTDQALCGLRWLTGFRVVDRHPLALGDVELLRRIAALRSPGGSSALWVSLRCQLGVEVDASGAIRQVIRVSTGRPRSPTPQGTFHVWSYTPGWVDSTIFPSADGRGNMLSPACFHATYCVHGSEYVGDGATWPGSNGCVRVRVADAAVTGRIQWVVVVF